MYNPLGGILPHVTVRDAIDDLPEINLEDEESGYQQHAKKARKSLSATWTRGKVWGKLRARYARSNRLSLFQQRVRTRNLEQRDRRQKLQRDLARLNETVNAKVDLPAFTIRLPLFSPPDHEAELPTFDSIAAAIRRHQDEQNGRWRKRKKRPQPQESDDTRPDEDADRVSNHVIAQVGKHTKQFKRTCEAVTNMKEMKRKRVFCRYSWHGVSGRATARTVPGKQLTFASGTVVGGPAADRSAAVHPTQHRFLSPREYARLQVLHLPGRIGPFTHVLTHPTARRAFPTTSPLLATCDPSISRSETVPPLSFLLRSQLQ